ncbi:MAG: DUF2207 domain-containing protein [Gemmatimonadaceae bacterium]|nr:DUF2207 domain-containing protein [Gemmatimonadaceae bacterium]
MTSDPPVGTRDHATASFRGDDRIAGPCRMTRYLARRIASLAVGFALAAAPAFAQNVKSLDWTAFSVNARLDSTGTLLVREQQTIIFNGDWNGGERRFDVRQGQRFVFRRMLRVDSLTGAEIPMPEGSLDDVDGYAMTDSRTVRWRTRRPDDPPFLNTKITYVLEYEYADILVTEGSGYRLDHEFGFRDRTGTIANFDLTLRVDPSWRTPAGFTGTFHEQVLEPGLGYVVNIPLTWRAAGVPSAVRRSPPLAPRLGLAAALVLVIVVMTTRFLRDEAAAGRFEPLTPIETIDRAWLETHVLSLRPELVGYAWDEAVGPAEVSATLARLVNERKLGSRVTSTGGRWLGRHVLHLELKVPRHQLQGYEKTLVDALFASGANTTSTDAIRQRYKKTGFDPSAIIRRPLTEEFTHLPGMASTTSASPRRWPLTLALTGAGIALLALAVGTRPADAGVALPAAAALGVPVFLFTRLQAYLWRRRVVRPAPHLLRVLVPMALLAATLCWGLATGFGMLGLVALAGLAVLLVGAVRSVLNGARSTSTKERLLRRKELASAREYCRAELRKPSPALDDSWFPYLLAFGLGRHIEKWFRAFGGTAATVAGRSGMASVSARSANDAGNASSGGTFSGFGGGGGFSGAGATVAFGSAVGAMASGVSAPSSSSSGGGRSSSGGSSGGGGGGGW